MADWEARPWNNALLERWPFPAKTHRRNAALAITGAEDFPGARDNLQYKLRINYMLAKYDMSTVCACDLAKFGAAIVMDVLRTHPRVIPPAPRSAALRCKTDNQRASFAA